VLLVGLELGLDDARPVEQVGVFLGGQVLELQVMLSWASWLAGQKRFDQRHQDGHDFVGLGHA
jgi:hypothetical protein